MGTPQVVNTRINDTRDSYARGEQKVVGRADHLMIIDGRVRKTVAVSPENSRCFSGLVMPNYFSRFFRFGGWISTGHFTRLFVVVCTMKKRTKPPPNYMAGLMKSLEVRKNHSSRHEREVWNAIWFVGYHYKLRTLRAFADALNQLGLSTSNGKKWSIGTASHIFRRFGTTPKQLHSRLTMPSAYAPRNAWSNHQMAQERIRQERLFAASDSNGKWHQAVSMPPRKAELVRHDHFGEGQFISELGRGRLRCRFLDDDGTFDIALKASEIEFFRYNEPQ